MRVFSAGPSRGREGRVEEGGHLHFLCARKTGTDLCLVSADHNGKTVSLSVPRYIISFYRAMVLMRVFSAVQVGSNRITNHISSKLTSLSNEITSVYQSARNQVRSFGRRRNSRNDRSMDTPFSYLSTFQQCTSSDKKSKKGQMNVSDPVLACRAMGFVTSPLLLHNNTPIPTLPDEDDKPKQISWRVAKTENTTSSADETVSTQNSQAEEQAKRAGRVDMDTILGVSELSATDDVSSDNKESVLYKPKMDIDEKPVEICWRVAKGESTVLPKDETTPIEEVQKEDSAKRAGLVNVDALLHAIEPSEPEHLPSADNDSVIINLRLDIDQIEKNRTKHLKKTLRKRAEKYEEVKDDFQNEIKRCDIMLDTIPEDKDIERFCRTKKTSNAANRNWICRKYALKAPKAKTSSSSKTAMPPFNQDSPITSAISQGEEKKTSVVENVQAGGMSTLSISIGCDNTSQYKGGDHVSPTSDVHLAVGTDQGAAHQSPCNKLDDTGLSATKVGSTCVLSVIKGHEAKTAEKQKVVEDKSKVSSALLQQSTPNKSDTSGLSCEPSTHSSSIGLGMKSPVARMLADLAAPIIADCNNNSKP